MGLASGSDSGCRGRVLGADYGWGVIHDLFILLWSAVGIGMVFLLNEWWTSDLILLNLPGLKFMSQTLQRFLLQWRHETTLCTFFFHVFTRII